MPDVISRHIANSRSRPIDRTLLTDVWMMTGERSRTAAASTASMVRSLTTLIAGTPYRWANARSTISLSETTGTQCLLVAGLLVAGLLVTVSWPASGHGQGQRTFAAGRP